MKAQHTPTLWKQGYQDNQVIYHEAKRICVLQCENKQWQANAEHIVKCVNMHDELVETLGYCKAWIERHGLDKAMLINGKFAEVPMLTTIKKVLEKANS